MDLEKILKQTIILKDIAGEYVYNSSKYQANRWTPTQLTVHNGHAWSKDLHFLRMRQDNFYKGDVDMLSKRPHKMAQPRFGFLAVKTTAEHESICPQDSHAFKMREVHQALQEVCKKLGDKALADTCRSLGVNPAASIKTREQNGWKPTPVSMLNNIEKGRQ